MGRLFLILGLSAFLLVFDYYCFRAILGVFPGWKHRTKRWFSTIWWSYTFLLILGVFVSIYITLPIFYLSLRSIVLVAFFLTVVCKFVMLPFLLADDIRRLVIRLRRNPSFTKPTTGEPSSGQMSAGEPISRSAFLIKAGLITAAVPLGSLTWGITSGAYDYHVKRRKLILPNLPKAFEGIRLGQISDIHSGSFYNPRAVKGGVEMLMAEKPDFIFFTGDLVNSLASEMRDYQDIFTKVKAPLGVYSSLGNHDYGDYYFGKGPSAEKAKNLQSLIRTHELMGWDLLMNDNRRLKVNGEEIGILGVENWGTGRFPKYGKMDLAVKNTADLPVKLLLSHDPSHWRAEILEKYPQIDAMFSGHTHGMQFGLQTEHYQWSPVQYLYKEWAGFYREGTQQLYVNVGYGFLGYPGRVGILPEITIFELKRA
ncbi:metallophosphoesterase [Pedobacter sp. JY14-1]|uniref:metallophosphoesterase n=1 Tax=Pedobacter sp. JY14-1 TaxID=3034151 RepID=UPI0023E11CC4|nr:metallophosphoesterase [Pedobacter sp. JY14-1]